MFYGHREAPIVLQAPLADAVKMLYLKHDVHTYLVGGYGSLDRMTAATVREFKTKNGDIELLIVTAYLNRPKTVYEGYDCIIYTDELEFVSRRFAILYRIRRMVEMADYMIAYVGCTWGGAAQALAYGRKRLQESRIINLYE